MRLRRIEGSGKLKTILEPGREIPVIAESDVLVVGGGTAGLPAALAEARNATNGGLRYIFDLMTEQFKHDQLEKHINFVLKSELDPLDWDGKVALIDALLASLKAHLPTEIISQPPERYAGHYDNIVRAYVESMDQVKLFFRTI